jgi:hypothetical protein
LAALNPSGLLKGFYLAGGTAAALHMGHRKSEDFDFFSAQEFDPAYLTMQLSQLCQFQVSSSGEGTLHGFSNDIRLSFLRYTYPLLYPTVEYNGIDLADLKDIALMKIIAIANRGTNKDFTDLYFICKQVISLDNLLVELFPKKFSGQLYSMYHIVRSLQYFDDAEKSPPLDMLKPVVWDEVKRFFLDETEKLVKDKVLEI